MLPGLRTLIEGPPLARVIVVFLKTGEHSCLDLHRGGVLYLEDVGEPRMKRFLGRTALRRRVKALEEQLAESEGARSQLEMRVTRQTSVLAAIAHARTLSEAKARVLWAENPTV